MPASGPRRERRRAPSAEDDSKAGPALRTTGPEGASETPASRSGDTTRGSKTAGASHKTLGAAKADRNGKAKVGALSDAAPLSAQPGSKASSTPKPADSSARPAAATAKRARRSGAAVKERAGPVARRKPRPGPEANPPYLAAELGQPVDHVGEPIGAGSPRLKSDQDLQAYSFKLWRQMQRGGETKSHLRSIERAGLTIDDIWTAGVTTMQPTSSTPDEVRRYRQKMLFRANLLEAILSETVADLRRLDSVEPAQGRTTGESD